MKKLVISFGFAVSGIINGLAHERNLRIQWLMGMLVFMLNNLLKLDHWQHMTLLFLVFLVLSQELKNCAIEKICDSMGTAFDPNKKLAKDFAAASVMLFSLVAALIFGLFIWEYPGSIVHEIMNNHIAWTAWLSVLLLNLPIVLTAKVRSTHRFFFLFSLVTHGIFLVFCAKQPIFLLLACAFHLGLACAYLSRPKESLKP